MEMALLWAWPVHRHMYFWPHNPDSLALDPILSKCSWRSIIITTWVRVFLRHLTFTCRQPCRVTTTGSRALAFVKWGVVLLGNRSGILQPGMYGALALLWLTIRQHLISVLFYNVIAWGAVFFELKTESCHNA
jgi:hypothetical protein